MVAQQSTLSAQIPQSASRQQSAPSDSGDTVITIIVIIIILFLVIGITSTILYGTLKSTKTTDVLYNKCGNYLNWNNRKRITLNRKGNWQWSFKNDSIDKELKFSHVKDTWTHDTLFYCSGELVGYLDNETIKTNSNSVLKSHNGQVLYTINNISDNEWDILSNSGNTIAKIYEEEKKITIIDNDNNNNNIIISINNDFSQIIIENNFDDKSLENKIPLLLAQAIAAKVAYRGNSLPKATRYWKTTYILQLVFYISIFIILVIQCALGDGFACILSFLMNKNQ